MAAAASITILREHLSFMTERAVMFAQKKPIIPVCGMLRFAYDGLSLIISAFDGETRLDTFSPCEVKGEINSFCVDAFAVNSLLKNSVESEVSISIKGTDRKQAVFKIGKSKHAFNVLPGEDMPDVKVNEEKMSMLVEGKHLINISETICKIINPQNPKFSGLGIGLQYVDNEGCLFAWGGSGMAIGGYKISMPKPNGYVPFIMPHKVVKNFPDLIRGDENISIGFDGRIMTIVTQQLTIKSTVPNIPYADCYRVLSNLKDKGSEVTVFTGELRMALNRLLIHADKDTNTIVLDFQEKEVIGSIINNAFNNEGEEGVSYHSVVKSGQVKIAGNAEYLPKVVDICHSEIISMTVFSEKQPILISSDKDGAPILFMVMPIVFKETNPAV